MKKTQETLMTNKAYDVFCVIIGVIAAFVLYKVFVDLNVGSWFIQPPEPAADGTVSTSAMQASDVISGSIELFLSILIAFGGTIISIATGALKSLSRAVGIQSLWDDPEDEYFETEINDDMQPMAMSEEILSSKVCLEDSLNIAIKSENRDLTIALIHQMAGSNYLTGEDVDAQEKTTEETPEEK